MAFTIFGEPTEMAQQPYPMHLGPSKHSSQPAGQGAAGISEEVNLKQDTPFHGHALSVACSVGVTVTSLWNKSRSMMAVGVRPKSLAIVL